MIIHHVWPGVDPFRYPDWRLTWMQHHPDADFRFWREADASIDPRVRALLQSPHYTPVVKSDIMRWAVLVEHGGIYADTDMECLQSLASLLDNDPKGCFLAEESPGCLCPSLIAARPHHPFVQHMVNATLESLEKAGPDEANLRPHVVTGPWLVTTEAAKHRDLVTQHEFPRFYPLDYDGQPRASMADAMTVHHWEGEWRKRGPGWR
jgi:Glycosyltransferase sugar-binding region containing DXD motif